MSFTIIEKPITYEIQIIFGKKSKEGQTLYLCKFKNLHKKDSLWINKDHLYCPHLIKVFETSLPQNYKYQYCVSVDSDGFQVIKLPDNIYNFICEMSIDIGPIISVYNDIDDLGIPKGFKCIKESIYMEGVPVAVPDKAYSCSCKNGCALDYTSTNCLCNGNNYTLNEITPYNSNGLLTDEPLEVILECNELCHCPITCINRVVQRGREVKLQIFKTFEKGWGVRAMEDIPKGKFVCEYVGEIITNEEADRRGKIYDQAQSTYLFDLDIFEASGGDIYTIDAYTFGNVSRFFNHSCDPNLATRSVFTVKYDTPIYRIGFFATKDISEGDELSFDYQPLTSEDDEKETNIIDLSNANYVCKCLSSKCRRNIHL